MVVEEEDEEHVEIGVLGEPLEPTSTRSYAPADWENPLGWCRWWWWWWWRMMSESRSAFWENP